MGQSLKVKLIKPLRGFRLEEKKSDFQICQPSLFVLVVQSTKKEETLRFEKNCK